MEIGIHIQNLSFAYQKGGSAIFSKLNLSFEKGSLNVVLGPNGAGKSTLIKSLAGLIHCQEGEIFIEQKNLKSYSQSDLAKKVAIVLTESMAGGMWTVADFVGYGRYPFTNWLGRMSEQDKMLVEKSIERCGLSDLKNQKLDTLSDGNKQKVMLARALAQETDIILLDEPSTHLDIRNAKMIFRLLKSLSEEEGKTIVFSSHQLNAVLDLADSLVLFGSGSIQQMSPGDFRANKTAQLDLMGEEL